MTGREGQLTAGCPPNTPQLLPRPPDGAIGTERLSNFSEATQPGGGRAGGSNPEAHSSFQHANRQEGPGKIAISCTRGLGEEVEAAVGGCWEPLITPFWGTPVSLPDPAEPVNLQWELIKLSTAGARRALGPSRKPREGR